MNWLTESITRSKKLRNHYKMHEVDIFIKDELTTDIDANQVFSFIANRIPEVFFRGVDIIYIGKFDIFKEKDTNALYQDGAIYVTNEQDNYQDLVDDIVHEIAHSVEELYRDTIYGDNQLKKEFLSKRKSLYWLLQSNDYKPYSKIMNSYHYDKDIDMYFYKEVGYDTMWHMVTGIFPTPYSATSLREYFAIGFEEYYIGDHNTLSKTCPVLFYKLSELNHLEDQ